MSRRIAKFIADASIASRRQAELLVKAGQVMINNLVVTNPATNVADEDVIKVNGKIVRHKNEVKLFAFYKPKGVITSRHDPQGRPLVFDSLPKKLKQFITVGRLDYNSEGLLLLTNSGDLARHLELPRNKFERIYRVRFFGTITDNIIEALKKGVTVEGITYGSITVELEKFKSGLNHWAMVKLQEGKNREIRKVFQHFDLTVNRLVRTCYAGISLNKIKPGEFYEVEKTVLEDLMPKQIKKNKGDNDAK